MLCDPFFALSALISTFTINADDDLRLKADKKLEKNIKYHILMVIGLGDTPLLLRLRNHLKSPDWRSVNTAPNQCVSKSKEIRKAYYVKLSRHNLLGHEAPQHLMINILLTKKKKKTPPPKKTQTNPKNVM